MEISDEKIKYPLLNTLEPSDAYYESPVWKRVVDKFETRLESRALNPTSRIHQTVRDLKQAMDLQHMHQHMLLTFNDLLTIKWNIRSCLVACNTLELMKQARASVSLGACSGQRNKRAHTCFLWLRIKRKKNYTRYRSNRTDSACRLFLLSPHLVYQDYPYLYLSLTSYQVSRWPTTGPSLQC
jgi:hypothetical protein